MDSVHLSDIDEDSAMNCLNPRGRKGNFVFWQWWKVERGCTAIAPQIKDQCCI